MFQKHFGKMRNFFFISVLTIFAGLFASCEFGKELFDNRRGQDGTTAIAFSTPTNYQSCTSPVSIMGTTFDAVMVKSVMLYITPTNGGTPVMIPASIEGGKLAVFRATVSLTNLGMYSIYAEAVNMLDGVSVSGSEIFRVSEPVTPGTNTNFVDTTRPILTIQSPTNDQKVGANYSLSGIASDAGGSGLAGVYAKLDTGSYAAATLNDGSWSVDYTVGEGSHTNYAYAIDGAGNISVTNSVAVVYEAGLPYVTITSPVSGVLLTTASVNVAGTSGVDGSTISSVALSVNSGSYQAVTGTTSWSLSSVALNQGTNTLKARVIAANGKTNFSSVVKVVADSQVPTCAITSPANGATISNTSVQIVGTASDSGTGVKGIYMAVDDNVFTKISSSTAWSITIALSMGSHTVKVYSADGAGLHSTTNSITISISDVFIVFCKKPTAWSLVKVHYWGGDCGSTTWPGVATTPATNEGENWYSYTFTGTTTSLIFNNGSSGTGNQTANLSRNRRGYYWTNNQWYDENPEGPQTPAITASPAPGLYTNTISVTLDSINVDDIIYYTTNGSNPTTSSPVYASPIVLSTSRTIKAFGVHSEAGTGPITNFDYTVDPNADLKKPTITNLKPTGHYTNASIGVSFRIYDNKSAATTAYYTTNGDAPTTSSAVYVSGNATSGLTGSTITITATRTFRFLVVDGTGNETTASYNYHMGSYTATRMDPRQETIYFLLTSRFYDGDTANSVGDEWCSYTLERVTPGSSVYVADNGFTGPEDVTWRGDFKGLVEKLDYIKALGFTTIWITPVIQNRSPLCYHGYHGWDFNQVDKRLESPGYDFQRLIDELHARDMKLCLDIVLNHSGRFGIKDFSEIKYNTDPNLYPDPDVWTPGWEYDGLTSPGTRGGVAMPPYSRVSDIREFDANDLSHYPYLATDMANGYLKYQWPCSESYCKTIDGVWDNGGAPGSLDYAGYQTSERRLRGHNTGFPTGSGSFDNYPDAHFDSCHEDCPDLNTENPDVQNYLLGAYENYIAMGVDMFRVDTVMHMHKTTLNNYYWPQLLNYADANSSARGGAEFFIFGEVANFVMTIYDKASQLREQNYTWDNSYNDVSGCNNAFLTGLQNNDYRTKDYSHKAPNSSVVGHVSCIDMISYNRLADSPDAAFGNARDTSHVYNDATYLVWYADSHDYGPNKGTTRYGGDFAKFWSMLFTFRGIPVVYYGSEVRFKAGLPNDWPGGGSAGVNMSLELTGRGYYGPYLEGSVTANGFGTYSSASGAVATTLNAELSKHLRNLNMIRHAVPALQMGEFSCSDCSGGWANYKRRYTGDYNGGGSIDSYVLVGVGSGSHYFSNILNGSYYDIVSGATYNVSGGSVTFNVSGNEAGLGVLVLYGSGWYNTSTTDLATVHGKLLSTTQFGN